MQARNVGAGLGGAAVGYGVWMALSAAVVAVVPVRWWAVVLAVALAAFTAASLLLAARASRRREQVALRAAPVLPALSAVYLLAVFLG